MATIPSATGAAAKSAFADDDDDDVEKKAVRGLTPTHEHGSEESGVRSRVGKKTISEGAPVVVVEDMDD